MRIVIVLFLFVIAWSSSNSTANDEVEGKTLDQIYITANDYLELAREYWPRAANGDLLAMKVTFRALNNCWHFKDEISTADNIDELNKLMQGQHPNNLRFAKGAYFKCKALVEHFAEFPGWKDFRLRAALAGDIQSKIPVALDFYHLRNKRPREQFPFSPAAFLVDAMVAGNPQVFGSIAEGAHSHNVLQDKSQTTITAWYLLHCRYRDNCDKPESMLSLCTYMVSKCTQFENIHDMIRHDAGSDEVYADAKRLADELYLAVQQRRFRDLGINLVW